VKGFDIVRAVLSGAALLLIMGALAMIEAFACRIRRLRGVVPE